MALYQGENQKMTGSANSTNRFISGAENLHKIAERIVRNDDLCKLLTRYNQNVLDDKTPVTNAERKELLTSRIKTVPVLEKEQEIELKTKLSETINKLKSEKFDQLNFLKLKNLQESI